MNKYVLVDSTEKLYFCNFYQLCEWLVENSDCASISGMNKHANCSIIEIEKNGKVKPYEFFQFGWRGRLLSMFTSDVDILKYAHAPNDVQKLNLDYEVFVSRYRYVQEILRDGE